MKQPDISKIRKALEKTLDNKRYEHTLGVAYTAASMAMRYGTDMNTAFLAGLLHDCAKNLSDDKKISICEKNNIPITEIELKNPSLLHAKVGSFLAMAEYHIKDIDILNAIRNHTTGRPDMSILEKIIFIADYIEPGRKQAPNLDTIRQLAFIDLDKVLIAILQDTLNYLHESNKQIDSTTQETYDFYCKNMC